MAWLLAARFFGGVGGPGLMLVPVPEDGLLAQASDAGYGSLPSFALGSGGIGYALLGNLRIGGWGAGASCSGSGSAGSYEASFGGGGFLAGYDFLSSCRFGLGADLTLGGWGQELVLTKETGSVSSDSLLADPGREASLERGGFAVGLGAHADLWLTKWLGLELAGGGVAFVGGEWRSAGGLEVKGTDEPFYNLYLTLYVLFGQRLEVGQ